MKLGKSWPSGGVQRRLPMSQFSPFFQLIDEHDMVLPCASFQRLLLSSARSTSDFAAELQLSRRSTEDDVKNLTEVARETRSWNVNCVPGVQCNTPETERRIVGDENHFGPYERFRSRITSLYFTTTRVHLRAITLKGGGLKRSGVIWPADVRNARSAEFRPRNKNDVAECCLFIYKHLRIQGD